ncbi:MAG TPA: methyltransferase domain-containing protein [Acidimicrobiia bacterium]
MEHLPDEVLTHYEQDVDEATRITEGFRRLELVRTREIVRRHLPSGPLRVLDVGGGAGVHAAWLAEDGHQVHLVDPVARHVDQARRLTASGDSVTAELGDARELPDADESFDAVLVLGPLYHLVGADDRLRALREARRVVRRGGLLFVGAISRFASLFDGLSREFLFDPEFRAVVVDDLRDGRHRNPGTRPEWFTTAYFHRPDELQQEAENARLDVVELLGLEGLAGWLPHLADRWSNEDDRDTILFAARAVESEPALSGLSAHLLLVARRPA